jgi:ketosteroid isomerase-like protein
MEKTNEVLIRELIENWAKAVRDKDYDAILAHHSKDIVMYDVPEPFQSVGIDAYKKTWDIFFGGTQLGGFDIQALHIFADENVAFGFATMKCLSRNASGVYEPLDFRLTIGLKKINGEWTILHEHHSVPSN